MGRSSDFIRCGCSSSTDLTHTALRMPYVLAFEPTFVEVRHVETGALMQIMQGAQLRCLFSDTPPSSYSSIPPPYPMAPPQQWPGGQMPPPHIVAQQQAAAYGRPQNYSRQSSYGPPPPQMMTPMYGAPPGQARPPMAAPRPSSYGSRSQIIMSCDGGTAVLRLHQTLP